MMVNKNIDNFAENNYIYYNFSTKLRSISEEIKVFDQLIKKMMRTNGY